MAYGKNIYLISEDAVRTQRFSHLANEGIEPPSCPQPYSYYLIPFLLLLFDSFS